MPETGLQEKSKYHTTTSSAATNINFDNSIDELLKQDNQLSYQVGELPQKQTGIAASVTVVWGQGNLIPLPNQSSILPEAENLWEVESQTNPVEAPIYWLKKEDPFTQVDLLNNEDDQVQNLILRLRRVFSIPYHESLADKLLTLFNDAKEEDDASPGISLGSFECLYDFLQSHTNLMCPIISLTPDNNIYASWKPISKHVFSVHFLSNKVVRFVIFKPNNMNPGKQIRISGVATNDTLMEEVASSGVLDWIVETTPSHGEGVQHEGG